MKRPSLKGDYWRLDVILKRKAVSLTLSPNFGVLRSFGEVYSRTVDKPLGFLSLGLTSKTFSCNLGFCKISVFRSEGVCSAVQRSRTGDRYKQLLQ